MNWYKLAKKLLAPEEMDALRSLVKKIMEGRRDWTAQELQLQQNFPEEVEEMLTQAYQELA